MLNGFRVKVHAAGWVTVNVCVPIVMLPLRDAPVVFAAALYCAVPLPRPLPETVSQSELFEDGVHRQAVVMLMVPLPPPGGTDTDAGINV